MSKDYDIDAHVQQILERRFGAGCGCVENDNVIAQVIKAWLKSPREHSWILSTRDISSHVSANRISQIIGYLRQSDRKYTPPVEVDDDAQVEQDAIGAIHN